MARESKCSRKLDYIQWLLMIYQSRYTDRHEVEFSTMMTHTYADESLISMCLLSLCGSSVKSLTKVEGGDWPTSASELPVVN